MVRSGLQEPADFPRWGGGPPCPISPIWLGVVQTTKSLWSGCSEIPKDQARQGFASSGTRRWGKPCDRAGHAPIAFDDWLAAERKQPIKA
jgi:hypothetical protein